MRDRPLRIGALGAPTLPFSGGLGMAGGELLIVARPLARVAERLEGEVDLNRRLLIPAEIRMPGKRNHQRTIRRMNHLLRGVLAHAQKFVVCLFHLHGPLSQSVTKSCLKYSRIHGSSAGPSSSPFPL